MRTATRKPSDRFAPELSLPKDTRIENLLVSLSDPTHLESDGLEVRISFAGETTLEEAVSHYLAARENFKVPQKEAVGTREVA